MRATSTPVKASFAIAAMVLLSACGSSSSTQPANVTKGADGATVIGVKFSGDAVTPTAESVTVKKGTMIDLDITADDAGQIHVHSTPEQKLDYSVGHTVAPLSAATTNIPGQIEIESHKLNKTIVVLTVTP